MWFKHLHQIAVNRKAGSVKLQLRENHGRVRKKPAVPRFFPPLKKPILMWTALENVVRSVAGNILWTMKEICILALM